MIADKNKGIVNIEYNHLNLPIKIDFESDENAIIGNSISYYYDATGVKLQKAVQLENISSASYTEYDNGFIYERGTFSAQPLLKSFAHAEGYVEPNGNNFDYIYQYKDHTSTSLSAGLGNIRLSYKQGTIDLGIVEEKNGFYAEHSRSNPFGLQHKGYNNVINGQHYPYGYNGKEENDELGLEWLDFGARNYDASIGRFMNIDRYAESFMPISTYQYAANNPILYLDYNGDYITIGIEDDEGNAYSVIYENGKVYHPDRDSDGNIIKGGEYDGKDNGFLSQPIADLDKVGSTKQGGRIVGKLQDSSDEYNIIDSGAAPTPFFDSNSNTIGYNPNMNYGIHDGVSFNKSHINIGHEIAHAYDKDRGFDMGSKLFNDKLAASEINAVGFENYLRSQDGETKMRTTYGQFNIKNHLGGSSSGFFNNYIAPLGRDEVYKRITPTQFYNPSIDNTYVKKPSLIGVYNTREQKFISF